MYDILKEIHDGPCVFHFYDKRIANNVFHLCYYDLLSLGMEINMSRAVIVSK